MLTDRVVSRAKPETKPVRLWDERGLFLLVQPNGSKWWRVNYFLNGKKKTLSVGVYDDVSLAQAREKRDAIRKQAASGEDPSLLRRQAKRHAVYAQAQTFESVGREWLEKQKKTFAPRTYRRVAHLLRYYVYKALGAYAVENVDAPLVLDMLLPIEKRGFHDTAHRVKQLCGQICRYAVATGRAQRDPTADLKGALEPFTPKHYASVTSPADIGALLRAIDGLQSSAAVTTALKLAPYVFVRPGELRAAEWTEVDLAEGVWRIPARRMKMRHAHIVPLSRQAVALLEAVKAFTGKSRYVFPGLRSEKRPISNMTINAALRRLGYTNDQMTGHGFRSMASTRLNEMDVDPDLIELQLAHRERNASRAAYNRAIRLKERAEMMQAWADELDRLRSLRPA